MFRKGCKLFFYNSNDVELKLNNFLRIQKLHIPTVKIVPLGCQLLNNIQLKSVISQWKNLIDQPFILYVSTIEIRKNYQILNKAYLELMKRNLPNLSKLIFIGRKGWFLNNSINQLNN